MQILDASHAFLVEGRGVGSFVEVEVAWRRRELFGGDVEMGRWDIPPKTSSLPSPDKTILTPIALILRLRRYMGVLARTVVTSYVSRWWMTSGMASRPS